MTYHALGQQEQSSGDKTMEAVAKEAEERGYGTSREDAQAYGSTAGAVGGVAVCAATGLAPAAPLCGMVGAEIGEFVGGLVHDVGEALFGGAPDPCEKGREYCTATNMIQLHVREAMCNIGVAYHEAATRIADKIEPRTGDWPHSQQTIDKARALLAKHGAVAADYGRYECAAGPSATIVGVNVPRYRSTTVVDMPNKIRILNEAVQQSVAVIITALGASLVEIAPRLKTSMLMQFQPADSEPGVPWIPAVAAVAAVAGGGYLLYRAFRS